MDESEIVDEEYYDVHRDIFMSSIACGLFTAIVGLNLYVSIASFRSLYLIPEKNSLIQENTILVSEQRAIIQKQHNAIDCYDLTQDSTYRWEIDSLSERIGKLGSTIYAKRSRISELDNEFCDVWINPLK